MTRRVLLAAWWLLGTALIGCGGDSRGAIVVRGVVTYQGRPISNGLINFVLENGRPLGGPLQSDGTYEFRLPVGEYRVAIRESLALPDGWKEGDAMPAPPKNALPPRYGRPDTSELTLTVSAQENPRVADFAL